MPTPLVFHHTHHFHHLAAVSIAQSAPMATNASCKHFRELGVEQRSGLLHIRFQRCWQRRTLYELMCALDLASADAAVRLVVLSGEFSAACGGATEPLALKQGVEQRSRRTAAREEAVGHGDPEEQYIHEKAANFVMRSLAKKLLVHSKLLVAFVENQCVGLGLSVCSLCDLVYATESSAFVPAFSHLDPCTKVGPRWTVPHIHWLLRLGDQASSSTALQCGLVAGVVRQPQEFWRRVDHYLLLPSASLLATKRLLLRPWQESLLTELREEGTPLAAQRRRLARSSL
ncbi:chromodomain Y-like protein 2 [Drosophila teissieri]|uniref:chromodomain Y-like protein 2 n=1 Tax=Drosophila teissieri TaxID=7243 RepID=UPI001CBA25EA|nr:chromodomain Y-like protein 2 [Drosophila teissieri]